MRRAYRVLAGPSVAGYADGMRRKTQVWSLIGLLAWTAGCRAEIAEPEPPQWRQVPSAEYRARQVAYLRHCAEGQGPGLAGRHGQVCVVATGGDNFNRESLAAMVEKIRIRRDTSDFDLTTLLRMLYLDRSTQALPADLRAELEAAVLGFKYWLDQPGPDSMVWWSENHQILFHALEYLAGHLFPDRVFDNAGMTGREHRAHAEPLLRRWLYDRARFGFSEFHSNIYFNEDIPALVNLVDFAPDAQIRAQAAILLDILALDMASNYFKGFFATAHGRTYPDRLLGGLSDSVRDAAWIYGLAPDIPVESLGGSGFAAAFLATSEHYALPPLLEAVAAAMIPRLEHRQRDSIDVLDGPAWGIGYESWEDVMFWWGMTGYVDPEVIEGSFNMVDNFHMWEGETWKDLAFLRPFVGTSVLRSAAEEFAVMARGVVLETANTYVYRTPDYQLAGVQDYKPGSWTAQVHAWKAALNPQAYVFTTWPGGSSGDYMGGDWTGGFLPRALLDGPVGLIRYRRPDLPPVAEGLLSFAEGAGFGLQFKDYSHAYFPRDEFDEVVTGAGWTIGRSGEGYLGLWSRRPVTWATDNRYELIAHGLDNDWIVELGSASEHGAFAGFAKRLQDARVELDGERLRYHSPHRGSYEAGWEGPFTRDGAAIDLGAYPRFDNPYVQQAFGERCTPIRLNGQTFVLDFDAGHRRFAAGC